MLETIRLPSQNQNGHDNDDHQKDYHSNDSSCYDPYLHIVVFSDVVCERRINMSR